MLFKLLHDRIDAVSYRTTKTGKPIVHTMRIFGPGGSTKSVKIPPEFVGSILRGETVGMRQGKTIPPQELGGLLNASVERSSADQQRKGVELKNMLFDIVRLGKQPAADMLPAQKREKLQQLLQYLPPEKFGLPEQAETPEAAKAMWASTAARQRLA
jgi:ATP-dependent DNA ligase